jgi:hypothetical protein
MGNKIPVIGTAIVNTPYWLYRMIMSVDYPTKEFVIFNNNGRGQITKEIDALKDISHKYIDKIKVCHLPANIGCSGAWNMIIKCYMMEPYWIISNHDLCFQKGFLHKMVEASADAETGIVNAGYNQWEIFLIKDWVIQEYGLFDENFYPAYAEDLDYLMRLLVKPVKQIHVGTGYLHGEEDYSTSGSQTWRSDLSLKEKMDTSRYLNEHEYMTEKWGSEWRSLKPYENPFNLCNNPLSATKKYDLNFLRRKHTGF